METSSDISISWRLAKSIKALQDKINSSFPLRSRISDVDVEERRIGERGNDHNPYLADPFDKSVGIVTALDITHDPDNGCDCDKITQAIVRSKDIRVKYIIWNRRVVSSMYMPWIWRDYNGKNIHARSFHISVKPDPEFYDDTIMTDWMIS